MTQPIYLHRDTAANWSSANTVLAPGEPGMETDTGKIELGVATGTPWNSLGYVGIPVIGVGPPVAPPATGVSNLYIDSAGNQQLYLYSGSPTAWAKVGPSLTASNKFQATGKTGFVGIEAAGTDGIFSVLAQETPPNGEMRFRLSRATVDSSGGKDFLITTYAFGLALEYKGFTQWNTSTFGVGAAEPYTNIPGSIGQGYGGVILAFDQPDIGGMFMSAKGTTPAGLPTGPFGVLCNQKYDGTSNGPMRFITRGASGFQFATGPINGETFHTSTNQNGQWCFLGQSGAPGGVSPVYQGVSTVAGFGVVPAYSVWRQAGFSGDAFQVVDGFGQYMRIDSGGGIYPGDDQRGILGPALRGGNAGAPTAALGGVGDVYFRSDTPTIANQRIYVKIAAAIWTGIL